MSKFEVFVPFTDTRDEMLSYFKEQNVIRLGGLSVTEGVDRDSDESAFKEVAASFAQNWVDENLEVQMSVDDEYPYMDEFVKNGHVLGWEFEFQVYEVDDEPYVLDYDLDY